MYLKTHHDTYIKLEPKYQQAVIYNSWEKSMKGMKIIMKLFLIRFSWNFQYILYGHILHILPATVWTESLFDWCSLNHPLDMMLVEYDCHPLHQLFPSFHFSAEILCLCYLVLGDLATWSTEETEIYFFI